MEDYVEILGIPVPFEYTTTSDYAVKLMGFVLLELVAMICVADIYKEVLDHYHIHNPSLLIWIPTAYLLNRYTGQLSVVIPSLIDLWIHL